MDKARTQVGSTDQRILVFATLFLDLAIAQSSPEVPLVEARQEQGQV
jgi:hypothetical protein